MYGLKALKNLALAGMIGLAGLLAGCGGGGAGGGTTTGGTTTSSPSITLTLAHATSGASIDTLTPSSPGTITATVRNASGSAVSNVVVTFTVDSAYATLTPASGTATTNAKGEATMGIAAGATSGASTVTATATWTQNGSSVTATGTLNFNVTAGSATLTLAGATATSLTTGTPGTLNVTVKDKFGAPVGNALVTFSTNSAFATFNPASGTTLTGTDGKANMGILAGATSGAATVTVTVVWKEGGSDVTVTGTLNYSVTATSGGGTTTTLNMSNPSFGDTTSLSAYGTTPVSVNVTGASAPMSVAFTSTCAASGRAAITSNVDTVLVAGVTPVTYRATATYRDNGCAGVDTITASLNESISKTGSLTVQSPSAGSIQFLSASPTNIAIKGTGGTGRQESSIVRFKLLDNNGNALRNTNVNFALSTTIGGITISPSSARSDASTGEVQVAVSSGTIATPVRVRATIDTTSITTLSDQLTISSGIPVQTNTSLAVSTFNIDGWRHDGITTTLTVRLADQFSNPVPDNTAVNFIAEGSRVDSGCLTTNSACSVTFTSQALRPTNGRVTVLAYAVGNESFTDLNGNGTVDNTGEMLDANGASTDLGEAWVDWDEDGVRDSNEPFLDFGGPASTPGTPDNAYNGPDAKYNGVLCSSGNTLCSTRTQAHVYRNTVVVLSDSAPVTTGMFTTTGGVSIGSIDLGGCTAPGVSQSFFVVLRDLNANTLPAGTTVTIASSNGTIVSGASQVVPNTAASYNSAPTSSAFRYPFTIQNENSPTESPCVDDIPSGVVTVTIDPPVGPTTLYNLSVLN